MIQRIQSIFLLLAAFSFAALYLPEMALASVFGDVSQLQGQEQAAMADGLFTVDDHIILEIINLIGSLLAIIALFMFRNRNTQIKLTRFSLICAVLVLILSIILFYQDYSRLTNGMYEFTIEYGFIAPVLAIVFDALALRFINKDEQLVRSMDRLR